MVPRSSPDVDLLVIGAGPTGLTAALEARRRGMTVRIVDKRDNRGRHSKALVVHARTMEVFAGLGVAEEVSRRGVRLTALNLQGPLGARGRVDLLDLDWGDTDHPHWLTAPQYETEQVLEAALTERGVRVEWDTTLIGLVDEGDAVVADLRGPGTAQVHVRARWLLGADGGRSTVRDAIGGRLKRVDAGATFILADADTTSTLPQDEGHLYLHPDGLLIVVPLPERDRWRIIAHVPGQSAASGPVIDAEYLDNLIRARTSLEFGASKVGWTSRFALSHGVSNILRHGRVFLAGDAAHVHSPVGGQGLNTGVQDAHNLVWKLALADRLAPDVREGLLESYATERGQVAHAMVGGVRRATSLITGRAGVARRIVGALGPRVLRRRRLRLALGRPLAGLEVTYSDSPLVVPGCRASGTRVGNAAASAGGRVLSRLDPHRYTWVVREPASGGPWGDLPVVEVADDAETPAVALVRPDGYIAACGNTQAEVWNSLARRPALLGSARATTDPAES